MNTEITWWKPYTEVNEMLQNTMFRIGKIIFRIYNRGAQIKPLILFRKLIKTPREFNNCKKLKRN